MSIGWGKRIGSAVASTALIVGIVLGVDHSAAAAAPQYQQQTAVTSSWTATATTTVPQRARDTLGRIDAGTWPPDDGSGTKGGQTWTDREGTLPRTDPSGNPISYREWDVNEKQPEHTRDAERIVTGSDGSAWYTADHYATFTRMR